MNRDHVPDHIIGARGGGLVGAGNGPGRVYVFSGKTGRLLFEIAAQPTSVDLGFFFVAGVGDVNRDQTPDTTPPTSTTAPTGP